MWAAERVHCVRAIQPGRGESNRSPSRDPGCREAELAGMSVQLLPGLELASWSGWGLARAPAFTPLWSPGVDLNPFSLTAEFSWGEVKDKGVRRKGKAKSHGNHPLGYGAAWKQGLWPDLPRPAS